MSEWTDVVEQARVAALELGDQDVFYRGHVDASWELKPSLARLPANPWTFENKVFYDLQTLGGHLMPSDPQPWEVLFLMQHHGIPTRLLDWTKTFAIGVAFALDRADPAADADTEKALWVMDPYRVNQECAGTEAVFIMDTDFPIGYEHYFTHHLGEHFGRFPHPLVALFADASNERLRAQRGVFTLHRDLEVSLETDYPDHLRKIVIPPGAVAEGEEFLRLSGIDRPRLFPDLTTYGAYLKAKYYSVG